MSGTVALTALLAVLILLVGVALGWYLRGANSWCPECGHRLTCQGCGTDAAAWSARPRSERPVR